ncbi:MAG: hypothetical protein IKZ19_02540 [Clostridia bacterium]|nr:hypothetical protein [Clostridia bacterium]
MKKLWLLPVLLCLVLMFSSCGMILDMIMDDEPEDYVETSYTTPEVIYRDPEGDNSVESIFTYDTGDYVETEPYVTEEVETTPAVVAVTVPPIAERALSIDPYAETAAYTVPVTFLNYDGNISGSNAVQSCSFVAPETGVYFMQLNMMSDLKLSIEVLDSYNKRVVYDSCVSGGDGVCCDLEKDQSYSVVVSYYSGTGAYTLSIGQQKATVDMTGTTYIEDSIEFNNQENYYFYTPAVTGMYRFYISSINSDCKVGVYVYDSQGYCLEYDSSVSRDFGINEILTAGETYRLAVVEYSGRGQYTFSIGIQKPTVAVEGYNYISDSIQFANQEINYSFAAPISGTYRFAIDSINRGNKISLYVYDSEGYVEKYDSAVGGGEGINVDLSGGETYTISVVEYEGFVPYTLYIGYQKPDVDISCGAVCDSIQFKGQQNNYLYTASRSGSHNVTVGNTSSGFYIGVNVYNSAGYTVDYDSSMDGGDYFSVDLTAGETYTISVEHYDGFGEYMVTVE